VQALSSWLLAGGVRSGWAGLIESDACKGDLQRRIIGFHATADVRQCVLVMALDLFGLLAGLQVGQLLVHLGDQL